MRCKNCGWPNRPDETTKCEKCHANLSDAFSAHNPTSPVSDRMRSTVAEGMIFNDQTPQTTSTLCPKCGNQISEDDSHICATVGKSATQHPIKISDFKIEKPSENVSLNIKGHISDTIIKPRFNNKFGGVWFCFIINVLESLLLFHLAIIDKSHAFYKLTIEFVYLLSPVIMWLIGYNLVKKWLPIGKYYMCGAIYIMLSLYFILVVYSIFSLVYGYMTLIDFGLASGGVLLCFFGLFYAIRTIKKGSIENPSVWLYSGKKLIPIIVECIIPILIIASTATRIMIKITTH